MSCIRSSPWTVELRVYAEAHDDPEAAPPETAPLEAAETVMRNIQRVGSSLTAPGRAALEDLIPKPTALNDRRVNMKYPMYLEDLFPNCADDYRPEDRVPELKRLHEMVDCAEYASEEDFIELRLSELDSLTIADLWTLSGLLQERGMGTLRQFIGFYTMRAEVMVAQAIKSGEPHLISEPYDRHVCEYMPSPFRQWGEWLSRRSYRHGRGESWEARDKHAVEAAAERPTSAALAASIHSWNPREPS